MVAEGVALRAFDEGMAEGMFYKDIYKFAKERVEALACAMGKSPVLAPPDEQLALV